MLEIFEMVAILLSLLFFGVIAIAIGLKLVDTIFLVIAFCIVKLFIDRNATFNGFHIVWKQTTGLK